MDGRRAKKTMANALDADILREIIELLKMRVQNGAATFLVKEWSSNILGQREYTAV